MAIYQIHIPSNPIHSIKPNIRISRQKGKKPVFLSNHTNTHCPSITDIFIFSIVFFRCSLVVLLLPSLRVTAALSMQSSRKR
ncbi:hypothetical protein RchiOBHm_Chr5g0076811 [Rosa chinensis]|uniref:Uncharacterized protein n=1 Tax=Rosa chinensis TaxID=74649 RepID=A0A2P6QLV6_ROSCH|nr:hypothetical protein RchiOBHm_Chr5g0076811 [Rosa chinensis]